MTPVSRLELTRWLVGHTRALLPTLAASALARVLNQVLGVGLLVIAAGAVAGAASGAAPDGWVLAGLLIGVALAKAGLRYLEHYAGHWVAFTALARLRELFFARLLPQAPAATTGRAGAELTERATRDIDRVEVFFAHTFAPAVSAVVVPVAVLGWLAAAVDPWLALGIVPFVLLTELVPVLGGRRTWAAARTVAGRRGELAGRLGDDLQGVREVLGFGAGEQRLAGLDAAGDALAAARSRAGRYQGIRAGLLGFVGAVGPVAVVAIGFARDLPAGSVLAGLAVAVGLWGPARGIDDFVAGLDAAFAAAARVREVVDAEPLVRDPAAPSPAAGGTVALSFEQVSFSYPGTSIEVVEQVTVSFATGVHSCVVGASGSGKSTLARLAVRGWDPTAGTARLFGTDLREIGLDEIRRRVGLVPQHPTLLRGTLADNLRLAAPEATDDELRRALAVVDLAEWESGLPDGLATVVSERGLNLSGGQLQRVALARTLLADPDILVLDEALSQLDAATAARVRAGLDACRPRLTIIEITHRADLVADHSPVLVLDLGRVVEQGPAEVLRAAPSAFARLEARA